MSSGIAIQDLPRTLMTCRPVQVQPPQKQAGKGKLLDSKAYADPDCEFPNSEKDWKECFEYHVEVCRQMFCAFAGAGLTVKPSKCHLFMRQVKYVGHILRNGKRFPDPSKTQAIAEWKWQDITSPKALTRFLGLANWYSIYIHKYDDYAAPLMEALQGKYQYEPLPPKLKGKLDGNGKPVKKKKLRLHPKQMKIEWTDRMKVAFEALKQGIVANAELCLPNLSRSWWIESEASD